MIIIATKVQFFVKSSKCQKYFFKKERYLCLKSGGYLKQSLLKQAFQAPTGAVLRNYPSI